MADELTKDIDASQSAAAVSPKSSRKLFSQAEAYEKACERQKELAEKKVESIQAMLTDACSVLDERKKEHEQARVMKDEAYKELKEE
eukprot:4989999-Alexandrium_andersonii.AAC.1